AIEPVCLPLKDGRAWMLIRTQVGRLWESFSSDGISWTSPRPSRFISSDSPAGLARLTDGRIVAIWNCCQRYPYAHGGRQVLHAAISDDDGSTWHGFREVVRDPRRLEPAHPIRGDYGTAYPIATSTSDGKLVFATGQGQSTGVFVLDPEWLRQTGQSEDFLNGLDNWSVYGTKGFNLVPHPDKFFSKRLLKDALRVERLDADFPAGAVWNFPNGRQGTIRVSFQLLPGPAKTSITLTDHFSSPFDAEAELNGLFTLQVAENMPGLGDRPLRAGEWYHLAMAWDVASRTCKVSINNEHWKDLPQLRLVTEGANYLRFRSLDDHPVGGGVLIESISANVELSAPGVAPFDLQ
ncbi:MAG: exo-alpha-sialidase, partial [Planctomycetaceae bacterium]